MKNIFILIFFTNFAIAQNSITLRPTLSFGYGLAGNVKYSSNNISNNSKIIYKYSLADLLENPTSSWELDYKFKGRFHLIGFWGTSKAQVATQSTFGNFTNSGSSSALVRSYGIKLGMDINKKRNLFVSASFAFLKNNLTIYNNSPNSIVSSFDSSYANGALTNLNSNLISIEFMKKVYNKKEKERLNLSFILDIGFKDLYYNYNYGINFLNNDFLETKSY
ncbi:MAG: hypothetical protein RLZZ118_1955, partial [Bacteroidota bacterium]